MTNKAPTQRDVANAAGVSTATVSRVLNNPTSVKQVVRERVQTVINQLNYLTDASARSLAGKHSGIIGAVIPTLSNAIFADGIEAFEATLQPAGYSLMLTTSNYKADLELAQVRTLIEQGVDGILLVGQMHDPKVYELLHQRQTPYVETWSYRNDPNFPCVGFDNYRAGQIAPKHFIELGHRNMAVITGLIQHNDRVQQRMFGLRDTLAEHGIHLADNQIVHCPYDVAAGRQACRQLLASEYPPTAIICHNDILALGALLECQATGVSVPKQLSIIGFDDLPIVGNVTPSLTTLHIPFKEMGSKASHYLIDTLNNQAPMPNTELEVKLVVRQSTGVLQQ